MDKKERKDLLREHIQSYLRDDTEETLIEINKVSGDILGEMNSVASVNENFKQFMRAIDDAVGNFDGLVNSVANDMALKAIERKFDEIGEQKKLMELIDEDEQEAKKSRDIFLEIQSELNEQLIKIQSNIRNKETGINELETTAEYSYGAEDTDSIETAATDEYEETADEYEEAIDEFEETAEDEVTSDEDEETSDEEEIPEEKLESIPENRDTEYCDEEEIADEYEEIADEEETLEEEDTSDDEEEAVSNDIISINNIEFRPGLETSDNVLDQDLSGYVPQYMSIMGEMILANSWDSLMLSLYKHFHDKGPLKFGSFTWMANMSGKKVEDGKKVERNFAIRKEVLKKPGSVTNSLYVELDKSENEFRDDIVTLLKYYNVEENDIQIRLKKKAS